MTTTAVPFTGISVKAGRRCGPGLGYRLWQAVIFVSLWSIIFVPEFARSDDSAVVSWPYYKAILGFRYIDLLLIALVWLHFIFLGCLRTRHVQIPRPLRVPGLAFLLVIAFAILYGAQHKGTNFFFDWRGLGLGIGLFLVWSFWLQNHQDVIFAIQLFAWYASIRVIAIYLLYALGYSDNLLGVAIPVFDGPVLSCIVFTGILALGQQQATSQPRQKLAWILLAAACCLLVLLCLRRTYWGELGIGVCVLTSLQTRHRARKLLLLCVTAAVALAILGPNFLSRMQSLDPDSDDTQFSADNADHVHDIADAWDQIQLSPWMGIGVGTAYSTWHIRRWKAESVMVHNAPLHVWLKYGLAGLLCYLWFHIAMLRWLYSKTRIGDPCLRAFLQAAFAYLLAQFLMTLGFAPWPYSELQLTVLMSALLAASVAASRPAHCTNYAAS